VIGVATVVRRAKDLSEPVRFGDREFPVGVELRIGSLVPRGRGVEVSPLIPRLRESFPDERAWSARLRRALVPLTTHDGRTLENALSRTKPARVEDAVGTYTHAAPSAGTS
jgi:hypothetical protein